MRGGTRRLAVCILTLLMAGIDHSLADLDTRALFSFTHAAQAHLYACLCCEPGVSGAVILSTCNRTELYLSCDDSNDHDPSSVNPFEILCRLAGVDYASYQHLHKSRADRAVFWHLCHLASGTKSQIWGEDQIIAQVKTAIELARENQATDRHLEVLFRTAITAAKKIRTTVRFTNAERSVAAKTLSWLEQHRPVGQPAPAVLVIGCGQVGRLVASELAAHGYPVAMTRRVHHGQTADFPAGVRAIDYHSRYQEIGDFDAVVSATTSPHQTLSYNEFAALPRRPGLLVDLAVPRDIDKQIASLTGVSLVDIDSLAYSDIVEDHARQLVEIDGIIEHYGKAFKRWMQYRNVPALSTREET